MTSFTFSLEQLKAAPPEVRRWVEHEIGAALGALGRLDHDHSQVHTAALAACTAEEALQVFELIKDNFVLSQVFFELAREIYIHETTHHSIRRVWDQLFAMSQPAASRPAPLGITLPHVGPSEDIAGHAPTYPRVGNPSV